MCVSCTTDSSGSWHSTHVHRYFASAPCPHHFLPKLTYWKKLKKIIAAGVLGLPSYEWYCILLLTSCTAADTAISSWVSETSRLTPWLAQNLLTVLAEQPRPTPIWDRCSATSLCVWCFKIMSKITSLYGSRDMVLRIQWCGKKYFRVTNLASEN